MALGDCVCGHPESSHVPKKSPLYKVYGRFCMRMRCPCDSYDPAVKPRRMTLRRRDRAQG